MLSLEIVNSSVHMGSHVDAPFHYGSTCEGKPAKQIMDIPLEWCYGPGVVLDFTHLKFPDFIDKDKVVAGWVFANILWGYGAPIALGIDLLTHNQGRYSEDNVFVELESSSKKDSSNDTKK